MQSNLAFLQVSQKLRIVSTTFYDLLMPFKLMGREDILGIINPFKKAPTEIISQASQPIKVVAKLINTDRLIESFRTYLA